MEFINRYFEHLQYKRAYTNSSVIFSGGRTGLRLDRVLVCEVLQNSEHLNKCLRASYAYKLLGSKREHAADFKIDIVRANSQRLVWIHKDDSD